MDKYVWYIAGGAGFVGSHWVEEALADPCTSRVVVMDNYSSGKLENLKRVLKDKRIELAKWDFVTDGFYPGVYLHDCPVYFVNCMHPMSNDFTYSSALANGYTGMISTLDQSRIQIAGSIFISGTDVYPHNAPVPTKEEWGISHRGFYHWYGEKCQGELGWYICPSLTFRPGLLYGPRMSYAYVNDHDRLVDIMHSMMCTNVVHICGHGYQKRSMMDVRDAVRIMYEIATQDKWRMKRSIVTGRLEVNITGDIVKSESEFAKAVERLGACSPAMYRHTSYEARSRFRVLDNSLMKDLLEGDRLERYSFEDSIRSMLTDYTYQVSIGHV